MIIPRQNTRGKLFPYLSTGLACLSLLFCIVAGALIFAQEAESRDFRRSAATYDKLKVFSEIVSLLEDNYVERIKPDELITGAIRGMLKTLDPHTTYLTPDSYSEMRVETSGKFGGLGIEISIRDGLLTVVSPIEGTPAFKAGVKAGDKIIQIEDESTLEMTLPDAVGKLRGKAGTPIKITIYREDFTAPKDFDIVREIIKVRGVKHKIFKKKIGYVKIRSFARTTSSDLDRALSEFQRKGVTNLILDLRNNPGGLLNQAVDVADRFLEEDNLIVYTDGRKKDENMRFTTDDKVRKVKLPMIILVNGGSASASEIVAGALQDLGRAVILGTPTFGKGSVQTIIPLDDGSALRLTTARYYTPSGRVIQGKGIKPDIIVEQPLASSSSVAKNGKKKNKTKEKIRKFLREKDLKKHLKGKTDKGVETKEEDIKISIDEELEKDFQLRQAVNLLSGWEIMVGRD